jgi:hypothetical protein
MVRWKPTDVSEEYIASIFWAYKYAGPETSVNQAGIRPCIIYMEGILSCKVCSRFVVAKCLYLHKGFGPLPNNCNARWNVEKPTIYEDISWKSKLYIQLQLSYKNLRTWHQKWTPSWAAGTWPNRWQPLLKPEVQWRVHRTGLSPELNERSPRYRKLM